MAQFHYQVGDTVKTVQVERTGESWRVTVGARSYTVVVQDRASARLRFQLDGQPVSAVVADSGERNDPRRYLWLDGVQWTVERASGQQRQTPTHQSATDQVTAPMPGQVLALLVKVGAQVALGEPLLVLGAMKMETRLTAPQAGIVTTLACTVGDTVARGQLLVQLERPPASP